MLLPDEAPVSGSSDMVAQIALTADAALFCAVHDIMQSPAALANVMTKLRPGAWVAAAGGWLRGTAESGRRPVAAESWVVAC